MREKMKRKQKEIIDFFRTTPYKDEPLPQILEESNILPNFNYGLEKLQPPNPIKTTIQDFKDPSIFSEYDDEEYNEPPEEAPSLVSDVPANKRYSNWSYDQLKEENITTNESYKKENHKFKLEARVTLSPFHIYIL
jgi:hypothetical protein